MDITTVSTKSIAVSVLNCSDNRLLIGNSKGEVVIDGTVIQLGNPISSIICRKINPKMNIFVSDSKHLTIIGKDLNVIGQASMGAPILYSTVHEPFDSEAEIVCCSKDTITCSDAFFCVLWRLKLPEINGVFSVELMDINGIPSRYIVVLLATGIVFMVQNLEVFNVKLANATWITSGQFDTETSEDIEEGEESGSQLGNQLMISTQNGIIYLFRNYILTEYLQVEYYVSKIATFPSVHGDILLVCGHFCNLYFYQNKKVVNTQDS